jgi:aminoglycoside phosphotransferase (APT) family kinase protein
VGGGANNALYRIEVHGQRYACKLCVADERRRAAREYGALRLLYVAGLDIAPEPLLLDESSTVVGYPAVIYRWVPGVSLGPSLTAQQWAALLDSFHRIHALQARDFEDAGLLDAWFHWFDVGPYLDEMQALLAQHGPWLAVAAPQGQTLCDRLAWLVESCREAVAAAAVDLARESVSLRLCHVDPNLANALWHTDGQLRWVDWEYSGWGDPALNLAELRWHAASSGLSEAQHAWFRAHYCRPADDPGFEARLTVWDRILAVSWTLLILRALWSRHNGPDRVRLTRPTADVAELHARLVRFVERAERQAQSTQS